MSARARARALLPRLLRAGGQRRGMADMAPPQPAPQKKEVSKHIGFYKELGRPLSKVFLMSFFTYQACYWAWLKLEKEEVQRGKEEEVKGLMAEVDKLKEAAAAAGKK
ncbi:uncharacterized protein H6S33_005104 [Morchella sextelata]|uniref:uncharacterized protein n=1 Tax=Morchella sextelata TaxID=1174677 RepID=UPI001D050981|nr:uncharacterized protein H6S33_005104 [Morchella sextelata]KAH0605122.1 hypothetical protein H6S33_005104 [Morchella sextelata]